MTALLQDLLGDIGRENMYVAAQKSQFGRGLATIGIWNNTAESAACGGDPYPCQRLPSSSANPANRP